MIAICPARENRRAFTRWARDHGCRMTSATEYGVRDQLIPDIPEELLQGATLDGYRYTPSERRRREPVPTHT